MFGGSRHRRAARDAGMGKSLALIWQAPLPEGDDGTPVRISSIAGGYAIFLPPKVPGSHELFGHPLDDLGRDARQGGQRKPVVDRELARRSGLARPHAKRGHAAGGPVADSPLLPALRRLIPLATLRGGAPLFARCDGQNRRASLLPGDDPRPERFVAGNQRRRALRPRATGARRRRCRVGQHPAADGRRTARGPIAETGSGSPETEQASLHGICVSSRDLRGRRSAARPSIARPQRTRRRSSRTAKSRDCFAGSISSASIIRPATWGR